MSNQLLDIIMEGSKRRWCMTPYCTTCGALEYRNKLKELAGPFGGPLVDALEDVDIDELTSLPQWQDGLLVAVIDLPISIQIDGILRAWLPKAIGNIRFSDYVLFKIARYLPRQSDTRRAWTNACMAMAVDSNDFSLVESMILVLGKDAKNHAELMTIAAEHAKASGQMRRVLLNACNVSERTA